MSAPPFFARLDVARWARRGAAALGSLALNAALDSLELGKRCVAWLSHSFGARGLAVAALLVVVAGGAAWAARLLPAQLQSPHDVARDALAETRDPRR
jgi:hypothetical protein